MVKTGQVLGIKTILGIWWITETKHYLALKKRGQIVFCVRDWLLTSSCEFPVVCRLSSSKTFKSLNSRVPQFEVQFRFSQKISNSRFLLSPSLPKNGQNLIFAEFQAKKCKKWKIKIIKRMRKKIRISFFDFSKKNLRKNLPYQV